MACSRLLSSRIYHCFNQRSSSGKQGYTRHWQCTHEQDEMQSRRWDQSACGPNADNPGCRVPETQAYSRVQGEGRPNSGDFKP